MLAGELRLLSEQLLFSRHPAADKHKSAIAESQGKSMSKKEFSFLKVRPLSIEPRIKTLERQLVRRELRVEKLELENGVLKSKLKIAQSKAVGGLASWRVPCRQTSALLAYPKQTQSRHYLQLSQALVEITNYDRNKQAVLTQRLPNQYQSERQPLEVADAALQKVADAVLRSIVKAGSSS